METRNVTVFNKYKSVRNAVKRDVQNIIKLEQHEIASQCKNNPKNSGFILIINARVNHLLVN